MMKKIAWIFIFFISGHLYGQPPADSLRRTYQAGLKLTSNGFSRAFYPHWRRIYSLPVHDFLKKIDSLQQPFTEGLAAYRLTNGRQDAVFIVNEQRDIDYFFDKIILEYPYFHHHYTFKKVKLPKATQARLNQHRVDFNDPALLGSRDVKDYIKAFIRLRSNGEIERKAYRSSDNKRLDAYMHLVQTIFTNPACKDHWAYQYLYTHLEDFGSKHTDKAVSAFLNTCGNEIYKKNIDSLYTESRASMKGHITETYKTVDGYTLDAHIFLPVKKDSTARHPVMVYFHGGSWTEGSAEWAFYNCADLARRGWVGVSVEYRIADRHQSTPFESVKDARSVMRWLRQHAQQYGIDTGRIVASGNSAGGHLVLAAAMAGEWNESTDDLRYSASPNLLLVNAGVYDLYAEENTYWVLRDLKDKTLAEKISPQQLLRTGLPPMLLIHGANDRNVSHATAKAFATEMDKLGNDLEFHTLEGAEHFIWFGRFSSEVARLRKAFLKKYGYE